MWEGEGGNKWRKLVTKGMVEAESFVGPRDASVFDSQHHREVELPVTFGDDC